MADRDGIRKYVEAAAVLGRVTRARAEEIARDLVEGGEVQRGQAQQWVDELVERSRKASEDLGRLVRTEVARQLKSLHLDPEHLAKQVAEILRQSAEAGRKATGEAGGAARRTVRRATAKRAPANKAAAKKAPAKAAPAKKVASTKAPAKKVASTKAPAKKVASTKAPAKAAPAARTAAKKASN
jgi:polyhydroxyalkanoate synthesis regulator phasin